MVDPAAGVGVLAAVFAGTISFLSPCVLPLVPGYLSAVTGLSPNGLEHAPLRRILPRILAFVATFSTLFVLLGVSATGLGSAVSNHRGALEKAAGAAIVMLGTFFIASPFLRRLNGTWHPDALARRAGRGGPVVAGAAFAIAWTPCVGPTLGSILAAAALSDSSGRGALLLSAYSAGLALPFILTAVAFTRLTSVFGVVRRHYRAVTAAGGAVLIAMGVLVWTGEIVQLNIEAQQLLDRVGLDILVGI
jgi:cytochrome c-type biogenesis protein